MFPVLLDLRGKAVLVVGGGPVGQRKAAAARAAGGNVTLVDPQPPPTPFAGTWLQEEYRPAHLDGVWLLFACATPAVNARAVADAHNRRVWALDAGDPDRGGLALPAVGRVGRVTVAVGTGGAAPGLARRLRDELVGHLRPADAVLADLLADLRPLLKALPAGRRRAVAAELCHPRWRDRLTQVGAEVVRAELRATIG